jgi:hypothetical protein
MAVQYVTVTIKCSDMGRDRDVQGVLLPAGPMCRNDAVVSLMRISEGYHHCDHLSSYRHRLLNLADKRLMTQRWQSVGSALTGQAGKRNTLHVSER